MSDRTNIYTEDEMVILRAAMNLLREAHSRTIDALHGQKASGDVWQWITWCGLAGAAADTLHGVTFRHDRYTENATPEPQSLRA